MFTVFLLGFLAVPHSIRSSIPTWARWILAIALIVVSITAGQLYQRGAFTKISLKKKHEQDSFWTKNKDTIVVAVITNIITALLSFTVAYLLFRQGIK